MSVGQPIFIDMDGVLVDFISSAFAVHGSRYDEATYPRLEWCISKVLGISEDHFWARINAAEPNFWPKLDPYPWFNELLIAVDDGEADIKLLSSPSNHPSSHAGKKQWRDKHASQLEMILCTSKHLLAAPGRVLIDDNDGNCEKWQKAGGTAILFPQPWNQNHCLIPERMNYVRDRLSAVRAPLPPKNVLHIADGLVHGDRGKAYGHPIDDFSRTAKIWSAVLGIEVRPEHIPLCMMGVKISRECENPKLDNAADIAGYAETLAMVRQRQGCY